jgi:hypothetical protein
MARRSDGIYQLGKDGTMIAAIYDGEAALGREREIPSRRREDAHE